MDWTQLPGWCSQIQSNTTAYVCMGTDKNTRDIYNVMETDSNTGEDDEGEESTRLFFEGMRRGQKSQRERSERKCWRVFSRWPGTMSYSSLSCPTLTLWQCRGFSAFISCPGCNKDHKQPWRNYFNVLSPLNVQLKMCWDFRLRDIKCCVNSSFPTTLISSTGACV